MDSDSDSTLPPLMPHHSQNIQLASRNPQPSSSDDFAKESFYDTFPPKWEVPRSLIPRYIFKLCCFIFTWRGDLVWLHNFLKEGDTWVELHRQYLTQLNQVSTVQGLVLATAAVFISSNPPLMKAVNYTSNASYACLAESLVFSLFGLLFQLKASASGFFFQKRSAAEEEYWRGVMELSATMLSLDRARIDLTSLHSSFALILWPWVASPNDVAPNNLPAPVNGTMYALTIGWTNRSPAYLLVILPLIIFTVLTFPVLSTVLCRLGMKKVRLPQDDIRRVKYSSSHYAIRCWESRTRKFRHERDNQKRVREGSPGGVRA
ncbi:hypothetical protein EDB19DRAFT_2037837 [Suillus lakei]|nr:hypothetical protein EDB19DRAFT_2037837 [Suillus lakei]